MITQNAYLRPHGIYTFSIPALAGRFDDGTPYVTCPAAGVCAAVCYARVGTFRFPKVLAKHQRNLRRILSDLPQWRQDMLAELAAPRFRGGRYLRIHDAGDFFSDAYLDAWLAIARATSGMTFYTYTKEVARFKRLVEPDPPLNWRWVYSYGGKQDHLIAPGDRVADVFPSEAAITRAEHHSNDASDLLAVLGPSPVGMVMNNHPHLRKRIGERTLREWQEQKRSARRHGPGRLNARPCRSEQTQACHEPDLPEERADDH
ncbi:GP88 family protein [Saccharothrix xinjiangensis]